MSQVIGGREHDTTGLSCWCGPQIETAASLHTLIALVDAARAESTPALVYVHVPADIQGLAYVIIHREVA